MVRVRTKRTKPAPEGFNNIAPTLREFEVRLKQLENSRSSKVGANADEALWDILRINHERSRYIYTLFYKRKAISKELYLWLLKEKYADKMLIAKWKRKGYEKLCCLKCLQSSETATGNTCICRVPRSQLEKDATASGKSVTFHHCIHCGCNGCASTD